ncbi:MAG: error-prone DNA polymerase [Gammaproteobacteria bacterium]|nr:MAG: error-prone DNA polymerase [Gammaproteobacteria bacterium]
MAGSADTLPGYAELHCLSNFTFLRGASHPEELVEQAHAQGYAALALTDEASVSGLVRAHVAARALGLHLICGAEFRFEEHVFVLLVRDRQGWSELCTLITRCRRRASKGDYHFSPEDLLNPVLAHCELLWRPGSPIQKVLPAWAGALLQHYQHRLALLYERLLVPGEARYLKQAEQLACLLNVPCVAAGDVHMHRRERLALQHILTALRLGCTVQEAGLALHPNDERHLRPRDKLARLYPPPMLANSANIARRCTFSLDELSYTYPQEVVPSGYTARQWLHQEVWKGAARRYPEGVPDAVRKQIEHELALIAELNYEHYFLTIYDIVCFARSRKILCQGRGSAANSAVCFCLGITEVDPARVSLLFERFISKERDEPPDIDVDFEHERREEVIQYIYEKYGRERAGLAATVITYRAKSAIRDVARALGLESHLPDVILSQLDRRDTEHPWQAQLSELMGTQGETGRQFVALVNEILGFPRHLSQHVGGFVISNGPLHHLVPIENAAMAGRTVIQWDKDDIEALRLMKVDILGLGMLTAIRKALELINAREGTTLTPATLPAEDPQVYAMLSKGDSMGVFQVESRAQTNMLPRLRPACYYDLVIQVAIVRPGPIQGDMVHPYLRRRQGGEAVTYPSDAVKRVLERTLGVPIFQEQVIKLAMVAAGFSGGEADQLRRAMAAWKRNGKLEKYQQKLIRGMQANGYSTQFAEQLCRQISGFGEYGFPESHAASFALLVYVSAWIKHYYPAEFCCALLNSQPMGFYAPAQLVQDARRHGVEIRPVDIRYSQWDHTLEADPAGQPALRLGFRLVKGLGKATIERLIAARPPQGFESLAHLTACVHLNRREWEALASSGALNSLSGHRYQARWEILGLEPDQPLAPAGALFSHALRAPDTGQDLLEDYASTGLTLRQHPLAWLRQKGNLRDCLTAEALQTRKHGSWVRVAGLVIGRQRPGTASGVTFVTLEDETGHINVIVWLGTARAQRKPLLTAKLLEVRGTLEREGDVIHVIAGRLTDRTDLLKGLRTRSRDFH